YYRTVAEGVDLEPVLNRMGVGRYPNSAMPGDVGNFSVAGHRVTYGKPFNQIAELRPGDEIIVQTKDGFYTYTFRNFDIILPDAVEVLSPVPDEPEYKGKDRILTMTACNPMFSARERYVAYAELTDWTPAQDGPPESIEDSKAYDKVTENGGAYAVRIHLASASRQLVRQAHLRPHPHRGGRAAAHAVRVPRHRALYALQQRNRDRWWPMTKILVIDNYDSFVYTLVSYLRQLGAQVDVVRNDDIPAADVPETVSAYDGVLLSPGPGVPAESGVCPSL